MKTYNSTVHRSYQLAPNAVDNENSLLLFNLLYSKLLGAEKKAVPVFKIGDFVRIYIDKTLFAKGYMPNFSDEIYSVSQVIPHRLSTVYLVCDNLGNILPKRYYTQELSRVRKA